jgi:hypothetical protein
VQSVIRKRRGPIISARRSLLVGLVVSAVSVATVTATAGAASAGPSGLDQSRARRVLEHPARVAEPSTPSPSPSTQPRTAGDSQTAGTARAATCVWPLVAGLADREQVSWIAPTTPPSVSSYRIYRTPLEGLYPFTLVASVSAATRSWIDRSVPQAWHQADYQVQAVYADGTVTPRDCSSGGERGPDAVFALADASSSSIVQAPADLDYPTHPGVATSVSGLAATASYSPDGTRIAFSLAPDAAHVASIWVRRADGLGTPQRLLSTSEDLSEPDWSPDGTSLVVTAATLSGDTVVSTRLLRVDARTGAFTPVAGSTNLAEATWLPGSTQVVATDLSSDTAPLVRVTVLTGARSAVAGTAGGVEPAVSPDGRTLAFTTWAGGTNDPVLLRRVATAGGTAFTIIASSSGGDIWSPQWSPDGTRVLWLELSGGGFWRSASPSGGDVRELQTTFDVLLADSFDVRARVDPGTSDFNGDGWNDVLARDTSGYLWLYPGRESYTSPVRPLGSRIRVGAGWNSMSLIESAGDLNGDGHPDVVARDRSGYLWLYPTTGPLTGSSGWGVRRRYGSGWNAMTALMGAGDFNGDGLADLLARNKLGELRLYTGDGFGGLHGGTRIGSGFATWSLLEAVGDLGDDGFADFVARNTKGELWLFRGSGTGRLLPSRRIGTGWQSMTAVAGPEAWVLGGVSLIARDRYGRLWVYTSVNGRVQGGGTDPYGSGWNALTEITS